MYDGRIIANFILDECDSLGVPVTNLSLQKILFFCHAWFLVKFSSPLIKHEFEAWEYGPVLPYIYSELKNYSYKPITCRLKRLDRVSGKYQTASAEIPTEQRELLKNVVGFYSRLPAGQLVDLTHSPEGPWEKAWSHEGLINPGMRIDNANILSYYSRLPPLVKVQ